jgi:uncharacterized membrane protein
MSVSADGTVVSGWSSGALFRWTASAGMQDLGLQVNPQSNQMPFGINADGSAIAASGTSPGLTARWTTNAGLQSLPLVWAAGISGDGQAVVGTTSTVVNQVVVQRAALWTTSGGTQSLGVLPSFQSSIGWAISADGNTVVGNCLGSGIGPPVRGFRWTSAGGMQDIGVPAGANRIYPTTVTADGTAIAGFSDDGGLAFVWSQGVGFRDLIPWTSSSFRPTAISADGLMLVGKSAPIGSGLGSCYLWRHGAGVVDLNAYLPTLGVDLTGWQLTEANGLSADGSVITGTGLYNGQLRAWVVTGVPCPSAAALLGMASIVAARRRR